VRNHFKHSVDGEGDIVDMLAAVEDFFWPGPRTRPRDRDGRRSASG
jgi:hypothetical protein